MIIKSISFNVRGLNKPRKIDMLRYYFQGLQGGIDVILIQEHKVRGDKATNLGRKLFPKGKSWTLEASRLPSDCRWLVSGDFNMVENPLDKSSLCSKIMTQGENLAWEALKSGLHLRDTFNHFGKLKFTWDNRRRDDCRILGRLDQHYISAPHGSNPHLTSQNYIIRGDCSTFDHLPVSINLVLQDTKKRKLGYKMSVAYLQHAEVKRAVSRIRMDRSSKASTFFTRLRKFTRFYKSFCKR